MFYIIDTNEQFEKLKNYDYEDVYIKIIEKNDKYNTSVQFRRGSLLYFRSLKEHKGYLISSTHNENIGEGIAWEKIAKFVTQIKSKIFVRDKKKHLAYFKNDNLLDVNFISNTKEINNVCYDYYYNLFSTLDNINELIPISKIYEIAENEYEADKQNISEFVPNTIFDLNNRASTVFYNIEKNGILLDKEQYIKYYSDKISVPEYNISKGKIFTHYNLYTTTGRPSNSFNGINFSSLSKSNEERKCFIPENNIFVEYDINGYHPRLIGDLVGYKFNTNIGVYDTFKAILNIENVKENVLRMLYGGIKDEFKSTEFFAEVNCFINKIWSEFNELGYYNSPIRKFTTDLNKLNPQKLFNYIIQSYETYNNVLILEKLFDLLKNQKSKIVLYVYDSFLIDYSYKDGKEILENIKNIINYPVRIKTGKNYHDLTEYDIYG